MKVFVQVLDSSNGVVFQQFLDADPATLRSAARDEVTLAGVKHAIEAKLFDELLQRAVA